MITDTQSPLVDATGHDETRHITIERDGVRHDIRSSEATSVDTIEIRATEHQAPLRSSEYNSELTPPTNDASRHGALPHVSTGQDASQHDAARQSTSERDEAGRDVSPNLSDDRPAENWVDIQQAEILLREHGVSRTTRTIQRFCQKGDLESRLVPTETGSRYIINEQAIEDLAKRLRETLPGNSFPTNETARVEQPTTGQAMASDTASQKTNSNDGHMREVVALKDQHISMLQTQLAIANNQIAVKDEQFAAMIERDHETNILIQNLQRMVGLPEAKPSAETTNRPIDTGQHRATGFKQSG